MEPAPPMEPPPAHLLGGGEVGDEISDIDDVADEIAHSFAYVRWNEPERNLRLFKDNTVSYDRKARHGYWEYWWDEATRKGTYGIHFHARPENAPKRHEFEQIGETPAFRLRAGSAEWSVIIVQDIASLLRERQASQSASSNG